MGKILEYFSSDFTAELEKVNGDLLRTVCITVQEVDKSPRPDQEYLRTMWGAREEFSRALAEI